MRSPELPSKTKRIIQKAGSRAVKEGDSVLLFPNGWTPLTANYRPADGRNLAAFLFLFVWRRGFGDFFLFSSLLPKLTPLTRAAHWSWNSYSSGHLRGKWDSNHNTGRWRVWSDIDDPIMHCVRVLWSGASRQKLHVNFTLSSTFLGLVVYKYFVHTVITHIYIYMSIWYIYHHI